MEKNNNVENTTVVEQKPKKKGTIIVVVLLVLIILGLAGYICYDKFIAKKPETNNNQKENEKPETNSDCEGYKTFTKYEKDNNYFYNLCIKGEIEAYSSDIKIVYDNDDMDIGFYQYADSKTYIPRNGEVSKDLVTKTITNEDGNDLVTFGKLYAEASGDLAKNFLWLYTDTYDSNTCVSKEFLEILSNQIYGKDGMFVKELFKDDDPNHGDNMYCFGTYGFGPGQDFEYVSKEESDTKITIKYKNLSGWDDMTGKAYATISFKIEDGFWIITDYTLGDD